MPTLDINVPGAKKLYAERIAGEIDKSIVERNPPRHSWRIKPSSIGGECLAKEWFRWRWVKLIQHKARTLRIFDRGNKSEFGFSEYLRDIGFTVLDKDPNRVKANKTNQQWKYKDFDGHMTGYLDAIVSHPGYTSGLWVLAEYKTFKKDRFSQYVKKGLIISDPEYYTQVCLGMKYYDLPWCLVLGVCKDDDELHIEIIMRNDEEVVRAIQRGAVIINSPNRPTRLAESPTHFKCKMCDYSDVCHSGAPMDKNCRSCRHAQPAANGQWLCGHYGQIIPGHIITVGCENHMRVM